MLSARQSVAKTVFFAVANGAHCASTAAKLSGQCRPQPNGREGKKPRSYNHSKPACDHQLDKPVALLVPIHLISCSRALKGSSGLTKKAACLSAQSGAHFLLEATMGGMPPYERSVPVAGRASLLFSNEKRASLNDAPFAVRAALGAGSTHRERRQIANTQCNPQAERNGTLRLRWMGIIRKTAVCRLKFPQTIPAEHLVLRDDALPKEHREAPDRVLPVLLHDEGAQCHKSPSSDAR